ncbi:MAG: hypothetical protein APF76_04445 [Desulfitibacter sp. BRH_c19]|nr:MAG: hypothetical protein APF76_04445 [Desulfitibacter sp. BRH_c19]
MKGLLEKELKNLLKAATVVLILLAIFLFYYYLFPAAWNIVHRTIPLILPFIIALVFVGLLEPIVSFFENNLKVSRTLIILLVIALFFAGIIGLFTWLISMLVIELVKFSNEYPKFASSINESVLESIDNLQNIYTAIDVPPQLMDLLEESISTILASVRDISLLLLNFLIDMAALLPMGILVFVFAVIAVFFISRDKNIILKSFNNHLPPSIYKRIVAVGSESGSAVTGYIRAQVILMFITASVTFLGLQIVGATYSLLVAVLVGIADILPVFGPGAVFVPWIFVEIINGNYSFAVILLIIYTIVSVVRQVIQPKIVGDSIGLHPLEALMALFIGLRLMGVLGLILGPIIWVVIKASWKSGVFNRNY